MVSEKVCTQAMCVMIPEEEEEEEESEVEVERKEPEKALATISCATWWMR